MTAISIAEALARLSPVPRLVVLMCGIAGSGKTTFSQQLATRGFTRISIDEIIWNSAGRYGLDYLPEAYPEKLAGAREVLKVELERFLAEQRAIVVDSAFWSKAHCQSFAAIVALNGGRHCLVYLKVSKADLQARLKQRRHRFDANAALPIDDVKLERFIATFEEPGPDEDALVVIG